MRVGRGTTTVLALCAVGIFGAFTIFVAPRILWNRTRSMPLGFYWIQRPTETLRLGETVVFPIPKPVENLVLERYLKKGDVMMKPVVALPGDRVCVRGKEFYVNDTLIGPVHDADSHQRPLPSITDCGTVSPGLLYVASKHPQSFDSRAFGPIKQIDVLGIAEPLWTY